MLGAFAVAAIAFSLSQSPAGAASTLSLKGAAGRFNTTTFQSLGNSTDAQASWTNKTANSGKFSMLLTKTTDDQFAYAAAIVKGVEGKTVADLGQIGFAYNGVCNGGSPRFNLFYDTNGDGAWDGYTFYGCNNASPTPGNAPGWSVVSFDPMSPAAGVGQAITPTAKVVQLSVIIDIVGSVYVDDVSAAGSTVGEP